MCFHPWWFCAAAFIYIVVCAIIAGGVARSVIGGFVDGAAIFGRLCFGIGCGGGRWGGATAGFSGGGGCGSSGGGAIGFFVRFLVIFQKGCGAHL